MQGQGTLSREAHCLMEESELIPGVSVCSHDLCVFKERYLMSRSLMSSFHSAVLTSQLMTKRRTRTTLCLFFGEGGCQIEILKED